MKIKYYNLKIAIIAILFSNGISHSVYAEELEPTTELTQTAEEPSQPLSSDDTEKPVDQVQPLPEEPVTEPVVSEPEPEPKPAPKPVAPKPITIAHKKSWLPRIISRFLPWNLFKAQPAPRQHAKKLKGLVGNHSEKIFWIIDQLKKNQTYLLSNRLILYGPPGNGKSTLARIIAVESKWEFMPISGASIVGSYLGEGAQKIDTYFETAAEKYRNTGRGVVIFIDEIDAIARANINYEAASRAEHQVATQALWLCLDRYKNHPGIFFVCATNHFDKLDRTFLDRFSTNTIEIGYPNAQTRKEVLSHYLKQYRIKLDASLLKELVANTDNLSIRSLEDLAKDIRIATEMDGADKVTSETIWDLLTETKKKDVNQKKLLSSFSEPWVRRWLDYTGLFINCHNVYQIIAGWRAKQAMAAEEPAFETAPSTWGEPLAE
jgi:Holliday junction resolvasome RuvABC ATP-dependent DNA helicase subunit